MDFFFLYFDQHIVWKNKSLVHSYALHIFCYVLREELYFGEIEKRSIF